MDQANAPTPDAVVEVKACFGPIVSPTLVCSFSERCRAKNL